LADRLTVMVKRCLGLSKNVTERWDINTMETCKKRADLQRFAHPQSGVDDLKGKFGHPTQDIPGVVDKKSINN
jgi:hypothetical protein